MLSYPLKARAAGAGMPFRTFAAGALHGPDPASDGKSSEEALVLPQNSTFVLRERWVDYGGVHFPEVSTPGIFSARGAGAHYLFVIPTLDMVIVVHHTDNDPPVRDAKTIAEISNRGSISQDRAEFGHPLRLILDAQTSH